MTSDKKPEKRGFKRPRMIVGVASILLLIFLVWFNAYWSSQNNSWISITPKSFILGLLDERKQGTLDKRRRKDIRHLESIGGAKGSKELLEIAFFYRTKHSTRIEAFSALARLGRPEDVAEIIEQSHWYSQLHPIYMSYVSKTLGEMGGESACQALTFKFLTDSEKLAYNMTKARRFSYIELINGIRDGECLAEDEILDRLRRFARDMWVSEGVLRPSLDLLDEAGDEEAESVLWEIGHLPVTKNSSVDEYISVMKRADLPVFIRKRYLKNFREAAGTKKQVMDLYLDVVITWINEMPVGMFDSWASWPSFINANRSILYS